MKANFQKEIFRIALFGWSGQLGSHLYTQLKKSNWSVISVGRKSSCINTDLRNPQSLLKILKSLDVDIVINAAAITDITYCESVISEPWIVNCLSSNMLSDYCYDAGIKYVYISTDQVYEDRDNLSSEKDQVFLNNNYAKTKYWGEPRQNPNSLTIRTSFFGRRSTGREGFVNYMINSISNGEKIKLYKDVFTSALADDLCAKLITRLLENETVGLYNVGTNNYYSKAEFGTKFIEKLGVRGVKYEIIDKPYSEVKVNRNVGMNCSKVEKWLNIKMPGVDEVVTSVLK